MRLFASQILAVYNVNTLTQPLVLLIFVDSSVIKPTFR
jgi:hypothetical protein